MSSLLVLSGMLPVEVRRSETDAETVMIEQPGGGATGDEVDVVLLHTSQVPAVIKALKTFLKEPT